MVCIDELKCASPYFHHRSGDLSAALVPSQHSLLLWFKTAFAFSQLLLAVGSGLSSG